MSKNNVPKNRLKELRDRSRLTLNEVSLITGFSVPTISRHESGGRGLNEEALIKYASLYKVHTYELFHRLDELGSDDSE